WWFIHFQDADCYGRIIHLQPVRWEDDWPHIGVDQDENGVGKPVLSYKKPDVDQTRPVAVPQTSDDFRSGQLGLQWQWHSNHRDSWHSFVGKPPKLRLLPQFVLKSDFSNAGNLLLQKFPAREFVVKTELELPANHENLHAGLIVIGLEYAALDVQRTNGSYKLHLLTTGEPRGEHSVSSETLRLSVVVGNGGACRFGIIADDESFYQIGPELFAKAG